MLELPDRQKRLVRRRRFGSTVIVPPFDAVHNIWSWDPDAATTALMAVSGPAGTVTTPVKTAGTPSLFTFGAGDFIDFGDALDATWTSATAGFTIYACIQPSTADLARANAPILAKSASTPTYEFQWLINSNQMDFFTLYGGAATNFTHWTSPTSFFTAGQKYVLAFTFDPTLARGSRGLLYSNGSAVTTANFNVGTDGTMSDTTAVLRIGKTADAATAPISVISYVHAYSGAHSAGTVASISSWLQNIKGWK